MIRLLNMHVGLIKYLAKELKTKRSLHDWIIFFKMLLKRYSQVMLIEYKNLFLFLDPAYRKQKSQYDKMQKLKVDLNRALKLLHYIDEKMRKQGISRTTRRQFWRDFFKSGQVRKETFDDLSKEVGGL